MKLFIRKYLEIGAFGSGLILLALMDPYAVSGPGWCLFEQAGISYCPGDGLGHSIALFFRGDLNNALGANVLGPLAILILTGRILSIAYKNYLYSQTKKESDYGQND